MKRFTLCFLLLAFSVPAFARPMKDKRDGQTYETVKIGDQVWMANNLNYAVNLGKQSWCYGNKESNCSKYGRLYTWAAAKNACPDGWHLPSKEEFETLMNAVGGKGVAGTKLKSTSGWNSSGNGTDDYGFSVLPAGDRYNNGSFLGEGHNADLWAASEYYSYSAWYLNFDYLDDGARLYYNNEDSGFSVRCLKDSSPTSGEATSSSSQAQLTDQRDGKTYKTVKIGEQVWMAEDLQWKGGSYDWVTALNLPSSCSKKFCDKKIKEPHQGVCPKGWHVPSYYEWADMFKDAGFNRFMAGEEEDFNCEEGEPCEAMMKLLNGKGDSYWTISEGDKESVYEITLTEYYLATASRAGMFNGEPVFIGPLKTEKKSLRCVADR